MSKGLLYAKSYPVNDNISIVVPTVGQIMDAEDEYYGAISAIIATPSDYMVQLDDVGIDFSTLSSYELFLLLFQGLKETDTKLIFDGLSLSGFEMAFDPQNGNITLLDKSSGIVIDKAVHKKICDVICKITGIEKEDKKPGNEEARKYMIERARIKQQRAMRKKQTSPSQLEELIVALVNTEQFKYNYEQTRELSIYQFNASVNQIVKKINYDNTMIGCYAGTINAKELSPDRLNWLTSK